MKKLTVIIAACIFVFVFGLSTSLSVSAETSSNGLSTSDAGKASCQGTYGGGALSKDELDQRCRQYLHSLGSDYAGLEDPGSIHIGQYVTITLAALLGIIIGLGISAVAAKRRSTLKAQKKRQTRVTR